MTSTRIIKEITLQEYTELINKYQNNIIVNPHALFRLEEGQRKVYNEEYLINALRDEKPILVGEQQNGASSAFFNRKEGYLRIIFRINHPKNIEIITFYITDNIPKI